MRFTAEETNLMCIYETGNRLELISDIHDSLSDVYDSDIIEIMENVINKLNDTTDEEFAELVYFPCSYYDSEE